MYLLKKKKKKKANLHQCLDFSIVSLHELNHKHLYRKIISNAFMISFYCIINECVRASILWYLISYNFMTESKTNSQLTFMHMYFCSLFKYKYTIHIDILLTVRKSRYSEERVHLSVGYRSVFLISRRNQLRMRKQSNLWLQSRRRQHLRLPMYMSGSKQPSSPPLSKKMKSVLEKLMAFAYQKFIYKFLLPGVVPLYTLK